MRLLAAVLLLVPSAAPPVEVFSWRDDRIAESSGLVDLGEQMVTTNDSGDGPRLFVVDERGETVRTVDYDADVRDVEALAPAGDDQVWVGDIGDNARVRDDLAVHRVRLSDGSVESFAVAYADGRSYDAESLVALPEGRLAVITKGLTGAVWLAPAALDADGTNRLERVAQVAGLATDAAYDPASGLVVVRGYARATAYDASTWRRVGAVPLPAQPQGEGISVGPGGRVRVSSEGAGTPVWQLGAPLASYASPSAEPTPEPSVAPDAEPAATADRSAWLLPAGAGVLLALAAGVLARRTRRRRSVSPGGS